MDLHRLVLPDGTVIASGPGQKNAIQSVQLTECISSGAELTLGSVCSAMAEIKLLTPDGDLLIPPGTEAALYRGEELLGIFLVERPSRPSGGTLKLTLYDRVSRLDRELGPWLASLTGWPYPMDTFASMVARECGLELDVSTVYNGGIPVNRLDYDSVTGRRLMGWCAELSGAFCRVRLTGELEFARFSHSNVLLQEQGTPFYFQDSLSFEGYTVEKVDAVQLWLEGAAYPPAPRDKNCYVIRGNPILTEPSQVNPEWLETILAQLPWGYTPCRVTLPYNPAIRPGQRFAFLDRQHRYHDAIAMTRTVKGRVMTLECTGSARRDGTVAVNSSSSFYVAAQALGGLTQKQVFDKLTAGGTAKSLTLEDGQVYLDASYLRTGVLLADLIGAGVLQSADGETFRLDLDKGTFSMIGTGRFGGSEEGDTYIAVDGSELCVYDERGVPTLRIGQHRSNTMFQLPYIKFYTRLTQNSAVDSPGMICRTPMGLWVGNAELDLDSLEGEIGTGLTEESAGIFISTVENKVTVYHGKAGSDLYTGTAVARFA